MGKSIEKEIYNMDVNDIIIKTKVNKIEVENENGLVRYKILIKYNGCQLTTYVVFGVNEKINEDLIFYNLLLGYKEHDFLLRSINNNKRLDYIDKNDLDEMYTETKRIYDGLNRLYKKEELNMLFNYILKRFK